MRSVQPGLLPHRALLLTMLPQNEADNQLVFLVRGTRSSYEWTQDFQLNQVGAGARETIVLRNPDLAPS